MDEAIAKALADSTRRAILDEVADRDGQTLFAFLAALCADRGLTPASMFARFGGELSAETLATFRMDVDTAIALGIRTLIMWGPWPYRQALAVRRPRADVLASYEGWFGAMPALAPHTRLPQHRQRAALPLVYADRCAPGTRSQ